jgi:pimeloyl-ACP methyl ester carboxylesterase
MPFLHRDGVALYIEHTAGRAPPVLLIHGWCCDHRHMAPLAEHFSSRGHAVVSLDLRGHGRSDKPPQAYPISAFADDVAWCCRELQLQQPVLIGHSMGGIVAYEVAARAPQLPGAIVMLDSAVVMPAPVREAVPHVLGLLSGPDYAVHLRDFVAKALFLPSDDGARKASILDHMAAAPQHVMVAAYAGLGEYDAQATGRVGVPALYIAADEPSPRCDMARLHELLPQLQLGQTVGSGHFCQLEVPEQVHPMIDRFLAIAALK